MKAFLMWSAVAFGILAAILWFQSARLVLYSKEEAKRDHDLVNYPRTVESQSKWNKWAAIATALSLLCPALYIAL
ncbi:MAG TPA: hypothetical protein VK557_20420 [Pyrinomonadaceae bacterium]|nr:hypothetical protein [Pyrinomonadaceae bacterium]